MTSDARTVAAAALVAIPLLALLVLVVAARPGSVVVLVPLLVLGSVAAANWAVVRPVARLVGGAAGLVVLTLALAAAPASAALAVLVGAIAVLATREPAAALAAGVVLVGFEGSIKILLGLEHAPLPGGNRAAGAAAIDIALFAAVMAVVLRDRLRTPRAIWRAASRAERVALGALCGWFALSIVQIAQGGDLSRGLHGFRLFQAYGALALAGAIVFSGPGPRVSAAVKALLGIGLAVSAYAAFRVAVGPSHAEFVFATSIHTIADYGEALRAIGSFSSAIGLISFLTPLSVFALVLGFLDCRVRVAAWIVAALSIVGLLGSYGRASLFGIALGLLAALVLLLFTAGVERRRKLLAAGLAAALLCGIYGGLLVASQAAPSLEARARGVLHPFQDESLRLRFDNWRGRLDEAVHDPLGQGVGAVGAASARAGQPIVSTDNSYLKVLLDQGFAGLAVFILGVFGTVAVVARRLRRSAPGPRALGVAALGGFVAFLGISVAGEYVEQPGKVVAWGLLGIAAAQAFRAPEAEEPS